MNEYAATLSIDLGASYTKVSFRPKLPQGDGPQSEAAAKILVLDGSPLIPSLAIYAGRVDRPWVFGREAALQPMAAGMSRFINWKSNFFREGNDEHSVEATIIAVHFLVGCEKGWPGLTRILKIAKRAWQSPHLMEKKRKLKCWQSAWN
jgi:hypothetical protein